MADIKLNLCRTFHPVGQGLFCSERLNIEGQPNPINVVYDCGCFEPSREVRKQYYLQKTLSDKISDAFLDNAPIYCVFISHLHYDHISGLRELLKHSVKYLFLPQLSPALMLESVLYSRCYASVDGFNETLSLMQSLSENSEHIGDARIIQVIPNRNIDSEAETTAVDLLRVAAHANDSLGHEICNYRIRIGKYWEYVPFNYASSPQHEQLVERLQSVKELSHCFANGEVNFNALASAFANQNIVNMCKEIYKSVFSSENEYSMPVYSGPVSLKKIKCCCNDHRYCRWCDDCYRRHCYCYGACLYTGDFPASNPTLYGMMKNFYTRLGAWKRISLVQVPHHGSYYSHNADLLYVRAFCCYVCWNKKSISSSRL
ncbi:MAG TPA: hypothetical protein DIW30_00595 [Bacteroidales bacterium]|nr:hypothetical protein [Bacteroidales bacterium]